MPISRRIDTGRRPPNPSLAWWYLSKEAKQILLGERLVGRFGGMPGKAPYWMIQERGEVMARVEALFYIKKAMDRWASRWQTKVNSLIRG